MTRVNLVPPAELYDQHLIAEYRELPMVPAALSLSLMSASGMPKIPSTYLLGRGHVTFFYDKGKFLAFRYELLVNEMLRRGVNPDLGRRFPATVFILSHLFNGWTPTDDDIAMSRKRIADRVAQKPHWYRKTLVKGR